MVNLFENLHVTTVCAKNNALQLWLKKVGFFFEVIFFENLHASTYTILLYVYKVKKKPPRLGRGYQPPRRAVDEIGSRAHY